jgi:hypothetical protein
VGGGLVPNSVNDHGSDVEGNDRIQHGKPDIGAYESRINDLGVEAASH